MPYQDPNTAIPTATLMKMALRWTLVIGGAVIVGMATCAIVILCMHTYDPAASVDTGFAVGLLSFTTGVIGGIFLMMLFLNRQQTARKLTKVNHS